jgi:hypothetical protein
LLASPAHNKSEREQSDNTARESLRRHVRSTEIKRATVERPCGGVLSQIPELSTDDECRSNGDKTAMARRPFPEEPQVKPTVDPVVAAP